MGERVAHAKKVCPICNLVGSPLPIPEHARTGANEGKAWWCNVCGETFTDDEVTPICGACHRPYHGPVLLPRDCERAAREER